MVYPQANENEFNINLNFLEKGPAGFKTGYYEK